MAAAYTPQEAHDRRCDDRRLTDGPVFMSDASSWSDLSIGTVLDASETGVAIHTETPFAIGTQVDLEVFTGSPGSWNRGDAVQGRIQNLRAHHRGGYRLGVSVPRPKPPKITLRASNASPKFRGFELPRQESYAPDEDRKTSFRNHVEAERPLNSARTLFFAIAALVCLGIFLSNQEDTRVLLAASTGGAGHYTGSRTPQIESPVPIYESAASSAISTAADAQRLVRGAELVLLDPMPMQNAVLRDEDSSDSGTESNAVKDRPAQESGLPGAPEHSDDMTPLLSDRDETMPSDTSPIDTSDFPSVTHAGQFPHLDFSSTSSGAGNWIPLGATLASTSIDAPVILYVDTTNFVMHVVRDGETVWQFPVGLGVAGSTPRGVFTLGTKMVDPTWYNNGNPVPSGSDANPLGDRWMGLSENNVPTPIGIHPTNVASSVGQPASRGCIRMRPADAHRLYAMVPTDTPVVIGPGTAAPKL